MSKKNLLFIFLSFNVFADGWSDNLSTRFDWLPSYRYTKNIDNPLVRVPETKLVSDARAELKFKSNLLSVVVRPRFISNYQSETLPTSDEMKHNYLTASEYYLDSSITDELSLRVGRVNVQWGPTEMFSWSNPLVHLNSESKSFFHIDNGNYLSKIDFIPGQHFSITGIVKWINDANTRKEDQFINNTEFKKEYLLKSEYVFENAANYLGVTAAKTQQDTKHIGFYGQYSPFDGLSFYTDARTSYMSEYYSIYTPNFMTWKENFTQLKSWYTFSTTGFRYESKWDFRFEILWNQYGLTGDEILKTKNQMIYNNPYYQYNLKVLEKRGSEFLGQWYLYASLRIPNLGPQDKLSIFLRELMSKQDNSHNLQCNFEYNYNDNLVLYWENQIILGINNNEFSSNGKAQVQIGGKLSF